MDRRIRELEREASQGDVQAEATLLNVRVRSGDLSPDRVRLAARLGSPGARAALAVDAPDEAGLFVDPRTRYAIWTPYGKEACVRGAIAAARSVLPMWERVDRTSHHPRFNDVRAAPRHAIESAEAWVRDPTRAAMEQAESAAAAVQGHRSVLAAALGPNDHRPAWAVAESAGAAAWAAAMLTGNGPYFLWRAAIDAARCLALAYPSMRDDPLEHAQMEVLEGIRDEVVPWALGLRDPVAERAC